MLIKKHEYRGENGVTPDLYEVGNYSWNQTPLLNDEQQSTQVVGLLLRKRLESGFKSSNNKGSMDLLSKLNKEGVN